MATTHWFFEMIRVTSLQKQQEVLERFRRVAGLTAYRAWSVSGTLHIVSFWSGDQLAKSAAEVLIAEIDPDAVWLYNSGALSGAKDA
jgi:hypothetical protein